MAKIYRVVDCRPSRCDTLVETMQTAGSPEAAASLAIGENLVRGGRPENLRAKVYFPSALGPVSMVRLFSKVEEG
jgi:hypothetical protein